MFVFLSQIVDYKSLNSSDFSNFSSIARHNYVLSSSDSILTVQSFKSIIGFVLTGILNQKWGILSFISQLITIFNV